MACEKETTRSRAIRLEEFIERFNKALALRPEVSDEDFMAETEVCDEQYALGVVLPAFSAQEGEPDDQCKTTRWIRRDRRYTRSR